MEKLYISDLDGTLLNEDGLLAKETIVMLNHLISDGLSFTVASARNLESIATIMKDVNLSLPVICFNGSFVSDIVEMKHLIIHEINNDLAKDLHQVISPIAGSLISTYSDQDMLFYDEITSQGMLEFVMNREKVQARPISKCDMMTMDHKIIAFTVIDTKNTILQLKNALEMKFGDRVIVDAWEDMYYKPWYWLSIHSVSSTKAKGIESLLGLLNKGFDHLVVFGDNTNDMSMFELADQSFAVENASDLLKAISDDVIGHHQDNSVIKKIIELEK